MKNKTVLQMMAALQVIGMLTISSTIRPAKSSPTTIIVPDQFSTIQEGVNHSNDGDTIYVRAGTYYEHVSLPPTTSVHSLSLKGENKINTIIDGRGTGTGIHIVNDAGPSGPGWFITGFTVQNATFGIASSSLPSRYIRVENNIVRNNDIGIGAGDWGSAVFDMQVSGNLITDNNVGVQITGSSLSDNTFFGNTISNNGIGIQIGGRISTTLINENVFCDNNYALHISIYGVNNFVYHNSFINSQIYLHWTFNSLGITWDDGFPSGGNYWSDYTARYQGARELDASGIWDTPYIIDTDNRDRYPLMRPFGLPPFNVIPEFPKGTIIASSSMIIALAIYVVMPRWRTKKTV